MTSTPFLATSLTLALSLALVGNSPAITDPENLGQWDKLTKIGPDKDCPGFLVNLGPTGARAILKETSFVVKHVFPGSPADGPLRIDDEITAANGKPFSKHTFGKFYGMDPGAGYEGPIMDMGNAIEDSEGEDGTLRLDVIRGGQPAKVEVKLEAIGRFSDTFPKDCPKSEKLTARARSSGHGILPTKPSSSPSISSKPATSASCRPSGKTVTASTSPRSSTRSFTRTPCTAANRRRRIS
jgi:hypothetical protein